MAEQIQSMLSTNSPMASPLNDAPPMAPAGMGAPAMMQQGGGYPQGGGGGYPTQQYDESDYAAAMANAGMVPAQQGGARYGNAPPAAPRMPANPTTNAMGMILDDPAKKSALIVLGLIVLTHTPQAKQMARSLGRVANMDVAGTPYEQAILGVGGAAAFLYILSSLE